MRRPKWKYLERGRGELDKNQYIDRQIVDSLGLKNDNTGAIAEALGHSEMKII